MTYTIEPVDHWKAGDRAYCVRGLKENGRHIVEAGRVYTVSEARQLPSMMSDGIRLVGVDTGKTWGFWSSRFVCLRGRPPFAKQIEQRTRRGWYDAYRECAAARDLLESPQPPEHRP